MKALLSYKQKLRGHCILNINNYVVVMGVFNVSYFINEDLNDLQISAVSNFLNVYNI